ncbi:MAG: tetratricopeptide repeat protein [Pseudomonadota bacterium]
MHRIFSGSRSGLVGLLVLCFLIVTGICRAQTDIDSIELTGAENLPASPPEPAKLEIGIANLEELRKELKDSLENARKGLEAREYSPALGSLEKAVCRVCSDKGCTKWRVSTDSDKQAVVDLAAELALAAPDLDRAHYVMGEVYRYVLGNRTRAAQEYEKAVELRPSEYSYLDELGDLYYELGEHKKAMKAYKALLRLHPIKQYAYVLIGKAHLACSQPKEARKAFLTAVRLPAGPDASWCGDAMGLNIIPLQTYSEIGDAYSRWPKHQKDAIGVFQEAIKVCPKACDHEGQLTYAYASLAEAYKRCGEQAKAIDTLRKLLKADPQNGPGWLDLASLLYSSGKYPEATKAYEKALPLAGPDVSRSGIYQRLIYLYLMTGNCKQCLDACKRAVQTDPDNTCFLLHMAIAYLRLGRYEQAAFKFEDYIGKEPDSWYAYCELGQARYRAEEYQEAKKALLDAIRIKKDCRAAWLYLGLVYSRLGFMEKAVDAYSEVLAMDGDNAGALHNLGFCLDKQGQKERASDCYHRAGVIFLSNGKRDFAIVALENLKGTASPLYYDLKSRIYARTIPASLKSHGDALNLLT